MKEYNFTINNTGYTVVIKDVGEDRIIAEVNGQEHCVGIDQIKSLSPFLEAEEIAVASQPLPRSIAPPGAQKPPAPESSSSAAGPIETPIPGQIIGISVKVGEKVNKGQKLLTLEAMKLENAITADRDGVIKEIYVAVGDVVSQGQNLIALD